MPIKKFVKDQQHLFNSLEMNQFSYSSLVISYRNSTTMWLFT